MARRKFETRQLGRPPSTSSGRITVTIAEPVKMRASLFSIRHRVPLGQMVEEGLKLFMQTWREQAREPDQLPLDDGGKSGSQSERPSAPEGGGGASPGKR